MADIGQTYTGDQGALMKRIQDLTQQVSSDIRAAPPTRQATAQATIEQEGVLSPLAEERGRLVEKLFTADKELAQRYGTPGAETYIEDPLAREKATAQIQAPMWGALSNINTLIGARTQVLQDAMDRGMQIYQAGLQAKQLELDSLFRQLELMQTMEKVSAPPRDAIQQKVLFEGAYQDIKQLEQAMYGQAKGRVEGGLRTLLNEKTGMYPEVARVNALRTRLALPLQQLYGRGSTGQTGVKLLEELKDVMPHVTDTPTEASLKLADIKQKLLSKAYDMAETYGDAAMPTYTAQVQGDLEAMAQTRPQTPKYKVYTGR